MTHREMVIATLTDFGPLSSYGVYHAARARGWRMSPSSVRTRLSELEGRSVRIVGTERTPKRTAAVYSLIP